MVRRILGTLLVMGSLLFAFMACNVSEPGTTGDEGCVADAECDGQYCLEGECVECHTDGHCDGVCLYNRCFECDADDHCSGDQICSDNECVSGCDEFDCGPGGTCVEEGDSIYCLCEEDFFIEDQVCQACDCDIDNGSARCEDDGSCTVIECDDGYFAGNGECLGCECFIENGSGYCDDDGQCFIEQCDEGFFTEDDDPATGCECAPTDTPDPVNFTDSNCDGLDGDMSTAIFVSTFGNDDDDGVATRPVRSIARAIELATDEGGHGNVFIAEGVYEETLRIEEPVNLYGGYRDLGAGDWTRGPDFETEISGVGLPGGHRPVQITGIDGDMEIQLITIRAANANAESIDGQALAGSSVALTLYDNEGHVDVNHSRLIAGRANHGANGDADDGADGATGQHALNVDQGHLGRAGGSRACAYSANTSGGNGGNGGTNSSRNGHPGQSGSGLQGGGGGHGGSQACSTSIPSSTYGGHGHNATGAGASGADATTTTTTAELVTPTTAAQLVLYRGQDGPDGQHGASGSSGGGGGGMGFFRFNPPMGSCTTVASTFPGGAGGGSGGCGGQGGGGGQAGGASVGILSLAASVSVAHTEIRTDVGGDGGDGSDGGSGGGGGSGGNPYAEGEGGGGGNGAPGGSGGAGAGGEGGPSVGILHQDTDLTTDSVSFDIGRAGVGGQGAGSAPDGHDSIEAEIHEYVN